MQVPQILLTFIAASLIAGSLTPLFARLATETGLVSAARPDRWGARPTPLLGGAAIVAALLVPALFAASASLAYWAVMIGILAAFLLGLTDDLRPLQPSVKLIGQVAIAGGLALGGVRVEIIDIAPVSFVLTILWFVTLMNAINLIDNMDGLAAGVAAIAGGVLVLMAPPSPLWLSVLPAALAGACVGFLVHNFAPARVYMGDAGSHALGCGLAALSLLLTNAAASNVGLAVLAPLLVLGLPIYDIALVALTRRLAGIPVSSGGRDHTSHRLAALGLDERPTVLLLYGVAAVFALLGLLADALGFATVPLLALVIVVLVLFGLFLAEAPVRSRGEPRPPATDAVLDAARPLVRFGGELALDLTLATTALFTALLIRFEGTPPEAWIHLFVEAAPIVVPLQLAAFVAVGVYRTLWRFLAVTDLITIARGAALGTLAAGLLMLYPLGMAGQSRAVLLMDGLFLTLLVGGSRVFLIWLRHSFALRPRQGDRRVLIVGATESGEAVLRLLLQAKSVSYHPAGFLDDDPGKQRRRIAGVPVLGKVADLITLVHRQRVDVVILADPDSSTRRRVLDDCSTLGIEVREFSRSL